MKQADQFFTTHLMHWHSIANKRTMPWKGEKNPYKVWLSEIILQQTRVAQGLSYYQRFIKAYPTIAELANAADEKVFKLWEGLGYYSRCKNLLETARFIAAEYNGIFPANYDQILKLKGVGPYTAAAIASFAFGLPYAVVDGNVFRVLSRYTGKSVPIDSTTGKKFFSEQAQKLLDQSDPAAYNQAIMDFGAMVCTPQNPLCEECPLQRKCVAYNKGIVSDLPIKEKRLIKKDRWFTYLVFTIDNCVLVRKREEKDIWQSLFEFYLVETSHTFKWTKPVIKKYLLTQFKINVFTLKEVSKEYRQKLTHQNLHGQFLLIDLQAIPATLSGFDKVPITGSRQLAFPKMITQFLQEATLFKPAYHSS